MSPRDKRLGAAAWRRIVPLLGIAFTLAVTALPALAQESSPDVTETPAGLFFRWFNFAVVAGGLAYVLKRFGGLYFRGRAGAISDTIREAAEARARAQRELAEAEAQLARVSAEVEDLRRVARKESAEEQERIRALARSEAERIARVAQAEIEAAERAARQELRAIAARLATERAAALLRQRMNPGFQAVLFRSFVSQLPKSAP